MSEITDLQMMSYTEQYRKFVRDMEKGGYEVEHYRGRYFYEGPAVRCNDKAEVMAITSVPCQWDNMGLGWIVYPR